MFNAASPSWSIIGRAGAIANVPLGHSYAKLHFYFFLVDAESCVHAFYSGSRLLLPELTPGFFEEDLGNAKPKSHLTGCGDSF